MHRYDQQQSTYLPDREKRFTVMLNVLETLLPKQFVALDLACGSRLNEPAPLIAFPTGTLRRCGHRSHPAAAWTASPG